MVLGVTNTSGNNVDAISISSAGVTSINSLSTAGIVTNTSAGVLGTTSIVPIANGGTGSSTQNFVDLSSTQTVGGAKTFSSAITGASFIRSSGTSSQFLKADGSVDGTAYQPTLTLTTTGTSGAATLVGATLNIPQYADASGSTAYIQNGTSQQASSNFNISGNGTIGGNLFIPNSNTIIGGSSVVRASDNLTIVPFGTVSGASQQGITVGGNTIPSNITTYLSLQGSSIVVATGTSLNTAAFARSNISYTLSGSATLTNNHGFLINATSANGTNVYAFRSQLNSGTNRWNLFMDGTAANHLQGNTLIGTTTDNGARLQVSGGITASSTVQITGNGTKINWFNSGYENWYAGTKVNTTQFVIGSGTNSEILTLVNSGAATFSSSVTTTNLLTTSMSGGAINIRGDESLNSNFGITWTTPTYTGGLAAIRVARRGASDASDMMFFTSPNGDVPTERMRITSGGNLLVGTTTDNGARLQVAGDGTFSSLVTISANSGGSALRLIGRAAADASAIRFFANNNTTQNARIESNSSELEINSISNLPIVFRTNDVTRLTIANSGAATFSSLGTGTVYSNGGTLTNTNPSDSALKNTIKDYTYGLNEILQLKPKTYYYNTDSSKSMLKYGFVAQDVKSVMPDAVRKLEPNKPDSKLGLETDAIYVALVNAIKTLEARIKVLENK
jgi:hypothetical protein